MSTNGSAQKKTKKTTSRDSHGGADDIEKIYQKKTQLEHILLRPDTYVGSVEMYQQYLWVFDKDQNSIVYRQVSYVPGLYKIFGKKLK
jgi:DNA topoisomerase-2